MKDFTDNFILLTDSYKLTHAAMYPAGTEVVYSYFESRKGAAYDETVFFGLQYILMKHLAGYVVTQEKIDEAERYIEAHMGSKTLFNRAGWEYILRVHGGKLPLRIRAVPEGTPVPISNVMMTVENTDPNCWWLTSYAETVLTHLWYGSAVCTLSREVKKTMKKAYDLTAENYDGLSFGLQDFGARGTANMEQAGYGGAAHLVNWLGTDTVPSLVFANKFYDAGYEGIGFSVCASEHSQMTALGEEGEFEHVQTLLNKYPTGILSLVADSYDIYRFAETMGARFKEQILKRDGVLVIRPDSGNPEEVMVKLLEILWKHFGGTVNSKGYRVIDKHLKLLFGDGLDHQGIKNIIGTMTVYGYSIENIACFGMGGGLLYRGVHRDLMRSAFKCSAQKRNGVWYDIKKNPLDKSKVSKAGKLKLIKVDGNYQTVRENEDGEDILQTVFENGSICRTYTFNQVRANALL